MKYPIHASIRQAVSARRLTAVLIAAFVSGFSSVAVAAGAAADDPSNPTWAQRAPSISITSPADSGDTTADPQDQRAIEAATVQACLVNANAEPGLRLCGQAAQLTLANEQRALVMSILAVAQTQHGQLVAAAQSLEQALDAMSQANLVDPVSAATQASVYANAGTFYLYNGDYAGAIDAYTQAQQYNQASRQNSVGNNPAVQQMPELYLNRSLALRAIGRYDEAQADYAYYHSLSGATQATRSPLTNPTLSGQVREQTSPIPVKELR